MTTLLTADQVRERRCCGRIHDSFWPSSQCSKQGSREVDGKWYCGTHDPNAIEARRKKRDAKWDEASRLRNLNWQYEAADRKFRDACVSAIRNIAAGHNNPVALASLVARTEPKKPDGVI